MKEHQMPEYPIKQWFTYHAPTEEQVHRYNKIRSAAEALARTIVECCPDGPVGGPDMSAALRKVREAVMTANASIAVGEAE
jgi:hypothetical protein